MKVYLMEEIRLIGQLKKKWIDLKEKQDQRVVVMACQMEKQKVIEWLKMFEGLVGKVAVAMIVKFLMLISVTGVAILCSKDNWRKAV